MTYMTELNNTNDFGQVTPGNSMKWDATEPSQNSFSFEKGDAIADLAEANGQKLRCHNLVWYQQLPSWSAFNALSDMFEEKSAKYVQLAAGPGLTRPSRRL